MSVPSFPASPTLSALAAFLSFRYSNTDGVSAVARTWMAAFRSFGFDTVTVSGEVGSDRIVPGIGLEPSGRDPRLIAEDLEAALVDADVVVVENLLTIPMNLEASRVARQVLAGRRALVHHHDPPWHRERFAHITELPVDSPGWVHVAINKVLREELAARGIHSTLVYNGFEVPDPAALAGRATVRARVRTELNVAEDEMLVAHPVRAIARKNIPAALALCEELGATYWLLGPAEEDYAAELERLLTSASCRVIHRSLASQFDIYAACDHVTFPSTWEGFGNPPIEASLHRRSVSIGDYPVAAELLELGFEWCRTDDHAAVRDVLGQRGTMAHERMLEHNADVARRHFSFDRMSTALQELLANAGWLP